MGSTEGLDECFAFVVLNSQEGQDIVLWLHPLWVVSNSNHMSHQLSQLRYAGMPFIEKLQLGCSLDMHPIINPVKTPKAGATLDNSRDSGAGVCVIYIGVIGVGKSSSPICLGWRRTLLPMCFGTIEKVHADPHLLRQQQTWQT